MEPNNEKPLSALEKARLAKKRLEDKKAQELELVKQQEVEKVQNIHGSIGELQGKLKDLETQKELLTQQEAAHKKTRKESIGSVRGAIKELAGSEDTKEMLADENTKQEILGEDVEKVAEAKQKQKEAKVALKEIEKQIAETAEQVIELEKQTPEFKEAEALRVKQEEDAKVQKVGDGLLFGNHIRVSEIESGKSDRLIGPLDRGNFSKLTPEEKQIAGDAVLQIVNTKIDNAFDSKLKDQGILEAKQDLEEMKKYNQEKNEAAQKLSEYVLYRDTIAKKLMNLYQLAGEKAKEGDKIAGMTEKFMTDWALYKNPQNICGSHWVNREKLVSIRTSYNQDAKPGGSVYDPKEVSDYMEKSRALSERGIALLEKSINNSSEFNPKEDGMALTEIVKSGLDVKQKQIGNRKISEIAQKNGGIDRAESFVNNEVKKSEEKRLEYKNLAEKEVKFEMLYLENPAGVSKAIDEIRSVESQAKTATEALNHTRLLEAQYSGRLDQSIKLESNGNRASVMLVESNQQYEDVVKKSKELQEKRQEILDRKSEIETAGYSTGLFDKLSKISKVDYEKKMTEITNELQQNESEIKTENDKSRNVQIWLNTENKFDKYADKVGDPKTLGELLSKVNELASVESSQKPDQAKVEFVKKWKDLEDDRKRAVEKLKSLK